MPYSASIIYKAEDDEQKYITFVQLPGNPDEEHNEYFAKQVCMNYGWRHVSSQKEANPNRHLTKVEKETLGVIRKPYEFFAKNFLHGHNPF